MVSVELSYEFSSLEVCLYVQYYAMYDANLLKCVSLWLLFSAP